MDGTYKPASTDGSGRDRELLKTAFELLKQAGYRLDGRTLLGPDGQPFSFEILTASEAERTPCIHLSAHTGERSASQVTIRSVDDTQLQQRKQRFDFDLLIGSTGFSSSLVARRRADRPVGIIVTERGRLLQSRRRCRSGNRRHDRCNAQCAQQGGLCRGGSRLDRLLISGAYMVPM